MTRQAAMMDQPIVDLAQQGYKDASTEGFALRAFEKTDTETSIRRRIDRDLKWEGCALPKTTQFDACTEAVVHLRKCLDLGAKREEIEQLGVVCAWLLGGTAKDDQSLLQPMADLQTSAFDMICERSSWATLPSPPLASLVLLWRDTGETAAAEWLLREFVVRRHKCLVDKPLQHAFDLAIAECALADMYFRHTKKYGMQLVHMRRAWMHVQRCDVTVQRFVMWRYRNVLVAQGGREDLVREALAIERKLEVLSNQSTMDLYRLPWSVCLDNDQYSEGL